MSDLESDNCGDVKLSRFEMDGYQYLMLLKLWWADIQNCLLFRGEQMCEELDLYLLRDEIIFEFRLHFVTSSVGC